MNASYIPTVFRSGWVLERYYGWSVVYEGKRLKLLRKNHGPIATFLLLTREASDDEIADAARRYGLLRQLSIVVLNDFSSRSEAESRIVAGVTFRRVTTGRWFGVGTFILDLSESLDTLWARMLPNGRNECRKMGKLGGRVEFSTRPQDDAVNVFLNFYDRMSRRRGLMRPSDDVLQRMFGGGNLLMTQCKDSQGRDLVLNLTYMQGDQAYYLYGTRADRIPACAGRYAQWETIKRLKNAGFRWYDLGLVASRDRDDGIYWFKGSFGGTFVDFGREFQHVPGGLVVAYRTFRALRRRLGRVRIGAWWTAASIKSDASRSALASTTESTCGI